MDRPCEEFDVFAIIEDLTVFSLKWISSYKKAFVAIGGVRRRNCEQRVAMYRSHLGHFLGKVSAAVLNDA